ncbi:MAG: type II toxin-antitoxin system RelE/ParE family toxin [bacterium]|nr:type II toxin-antitoxin system RelE/ParE family toxin [bacterium]
MVLLKQVVIGNVRFKVVFFRTRSGSEPVRKWLKSLPEPYKKILGEDIKTVQFDWPTGMPLVKKIEPGIWEIRSVVPHGISRIFFTVDSHLIILLYGFIKKSDKIPERSLNTIRSRLKNYLEAKS